MTEGSDWMLSEIDRLKPLVVLLVGQNRSGKSLWARTRGCSLVHIEHPTARMHPYAQALYAERLRAWALLGLGPLLVETHSDHLLSAIGLMIAKGELLASSVIVAGFERDVGPSFVATYNDDGQLAGDWPAGFMSP